MKELEHFKFVQGRVETRLHELEPLYMFVVHDKDSYLTYLRMLHDEIRGLRQQLVFISIKLSWNPCFPLLK